MGESIFFEAESRNITGATPRQREREIIGVSDRCPVIPLVRLFLDDRNIYVIVCNEVSMNFGVGTEFVNFLSARNARHDFSVVQSKSFE